MRYLPILVAGVITLPLGASTVESNVSNASDIVLQTGDELVFGISIQDYENIAPIYGASMLPSQLSFQLTTDPTASNVQFRAGLESLSGNQTDAFPGTFTFTPGMFDSFSYSGPISELSDSLQLSPAESRSIFSNGLALLYIQDLGGTVTIGLPPYTLRGDLYATAWGGDVISIGADTGTVTFIDPLPVPTPEPKPALLVLAGAFVVCLLVGWRKMLQSGRGASVK